MHIFFSGIGGTGMSSMAMLAKQAGYEVSGSDAQESSYTKYLKEHGVTDFYIGQDRQRIANSHKRKPIDWFIYSSAIPMTDPDHPELKFCQENGIKTSKRDDFLNKIISDHGLKLIGVAGTHGKSTTTAMVIWLLREAGMPVSYCLGAKLGFSELGSYEKSSKYFVYETDEYDHNFLSFHPELAIISGIDWDHPDIYPTRESYYAAFTQFIGQSNKAIMWRSDAEKLSLDDTESLQTLDEKDPAIDRQIKLPGRVNRLDAWLTIQALQPVAGKSEEKLIAILNRFPGLPRRFEKLADNIYTDYAHTPPKIAGALQLAHEVAGDDVVVVYEGLHNTRQHFIKNELADMFKDVKKLYIVPSYLAREDKNLELLTPDKLLNLLSNSVRGRAEAAELDDTLAAKIHHHASNGDLVLALSAGGGGSLDEWLRQKAA